MIFIFKPISFSLLLFQEILREVFVIKAYKKVTNVMTFTSTSSMGVEFYVLSVKYFMQCIIL